ncbi:MAG: hypothetical protein HY315_00070 [Acidobacteria bacterium]|nr:hypothetical protein [Acidobacteriota bacterium]
MAHPQIAAFARSAEGNARATRKIEGQGTLLCRTMHAIAYDEIHDEIVVPQPFGQAVLTFRGSARGEEAPIRVIQGPKTRLQNTAVLTLDAVNNELFVVERDGVLVFPREGNGDIAPRRILNPGVDLSAGGGIAVDPVHDLLILTGSEPGANRGEAGSAAGRDGLLVYNRTDQGKVRPRAFIGGPKSGITNITRVQVYPPRGWIIANISGQLGELASEGAFVGVWSITDKGDVPPRWTIGGPKGTLKKPRGLALDPKNKTLIVSDKRLNAVLTFAFPEIF